MTLFNVTDPDELTMRHVRVRDTHIGKGVFAVCGYPATAVIGQITGSLMEDPNHGSEYSFEFENGQQLEPDAPFRYVNHSCDPNCEFDILIEPSENGVPEERHLYLIALREILPEEQLTIAYNWSASCAIECRCESENCVGWIVCETELDQVVADYNDLDYDWVAEY